MVTKEQILEATKILSLSTYKNEKGEIKKLSTYKIKPSLNIFELQTEFLYACEIIPEELDQYIPDLVSDIYNLIVTEDQLSTPTLNISDTPDSTISNISKSSPHKEIAVTKNKKISMTRVDSIYQVLIKNKGIMDVKELAIKANQLYTEAGKKDNVQESKFILTYVINTLSTFGIAIIENNTLKLNTY